jgi:DNA invertase Pin-like site-specific DNA recombinase
LPEQREAIERHAARSSLTISQWFEERETAAKRGRPIWNQMLKLLRHGKAAGVVIHKIDRSARNLKDWADLGELIDQGIEVHFANESLDLNSRGGRLSADIQAVVASDYIRNLREEAKKGIYGRLKQGFLPTRAPVGYLDNGGGKPKTIDPVRGPLIRKAFQLYAAGKFTILPLVDELYRLGLRNLAGTRVTRNGLSTILNNPFYMGLIRIQANGEVYAGNHEPLISKRLFDDVQDMLAGRFHTRTQTHDFLFRRYITCKGCGYSLIGELQKGHVYYRCHIRSCPMKAIREEAVSTVVEQRLRTLQFTDAEKAYLATRIQALKANWFIEKEKQFGNLNMTFQQTSERLSRLTDAFLDGTIEKEIYEERKTSLLFEKRAIEDRLNDLKTGKTSITEEVQKFIELAGDAYSLYQTPITEKKRRLLKIVTSNCSADAETLDFAYVIPFREVAQREKNIDGRPSKVVHRTLDRLLASLMAHISMCASANSAFDVTPDV